MASACVNNIGMSPETFPATTYQSYGWLSPRMSLSREDDSSKTTTTTKAQADPVEIEDPDSGSSSSSGGSSTDFEFRLEDPVAMLPADQLFSDGKLMPLHLSNMKPSLNEMRSTEIDKSCRRMEMEISGTDPYLFSPKAPRCSSRWRELLGLKKLYQNANAKPEQQQQHKTSSKSIKHFLHRSGKGPCSSSDPSFSLPLLKDCDSESVSVSSSRLSLSSSSSGHEHEDLPRLSLDSDKTPNPNPNPSPSPNPFVLNRNPNPPRMRAVKARAENNGNQARDGRSPMRRESTSRGVSVDSPRMNSSGKIVFQSLERSSSSPSSFNGGARFKHRGMERSYSANVRITPVLNVPVCSLRGSSKSGSVFGFGQLFSSSSSPQKKEATNGVSRGQQSNNNNSSKNRTDRT